MIYYCISDIHGCLKTFIKALALISKQLEKPDTRLILLGDYTHGGENNYGVLNTIIKLQKKYSPDKIIALMGNHEERICEGYNHIDDNITNEHDKSYIKWMSSLPRYHVDGNTIFVHAGVDEEAGEDWEYGTMDYIFTEKYPAQLGEFCGGYKIVAGHVHTSAISGDPFFNGIYYDGSSHYYIDADAPVSGTLNILKVDTDKELYFEVTASGEKEVEPF